MLKINHSILFSAFAATVLLAGCGDDYPSAVENPYPNDLLSIKILNAGAAGNTEVEGTIDEDSKTIKFPKIDKESDFSHLIIAATMSDGAHLEPETDTLDFSMDEEETQVTKTIRVMNHNRYKDYFMTIRKRVPVFGANFERAEVYDHTTQTTIYPFMTSGNCRSAAFDGNYVLVVYRNINEGEPGAHLLKVSDLVNGNVTPIPLSLDGVEGGTFIYNCGALAGGHVYLCNLSGGVASPLKIYYYETPESAPECIASIDKSTIPDVASRHGDNMSVNLDANGNGYIFFGSNNYADVLRVPVTNWKNVGAPTRIELKNEDKAGMSLHVYRVEGTDDYVLSGNRVNLLGSTGKLSGIRMSLCDESLNSKTRLGENTVAAESDAARVFTFNGSRYLISCPVAFGASSVASPGIYVYDMTRGNTTKDAFDEFSALATPNATYAYRIGGSTITNPEVGTNYYIEKDTQGNDVNLWLFVARPESGFAVIKVPAAKEDDE